jgi:hypothetical protein
MGMQIDIFNKTPFFPRRRPAARNGRFPGSCAAGKKWVELRRPFGQCLRK